MQFLVVEDDFVCRRVLTALLQRHGTVSVAVDGEEAITAVQLALAEGHAYEAVFLDINMPRLSGQEALARIRALEGEQGIPPGRGAKILMVTAVDDRAAILASFREQADAYLVKPVQPERLAAEMRRLGLLR